MAEAEADKLERDYEEINRLGELGYNIKIEIENTTHAKAKEQLQTQFDNVLMHLEYYGVTTKEKAESDPYWAVRSSQHQNGDLDEQPPPIANFLIPLAYAVDSPDFQLGYEHGFWTYFSWHQWTRDRITIQEDERDDDSIGLANDYGGVKAKWQVRGTNILVDHTYEYALNDGSEDVHSDRNYADDPESTIHNGNSKIRVVEMDRYNGSPEEGWTITADWTVQSINDYP